MTPQGGLKLESILRRNPSWSYRWRPRWKTQTLENRSNCLRLVDQRDQRPTPSARCYEAGSLVNLLERLAQTTRTLENVDQKHSLEQVRPRQSSTDRLSARTIRTRSLSCGCCRTRNYSRPQSSGRRKHRGGEDLPESLSEAGECLGRDVAILRRRIPRRFSRLTPPGPFGV